MKSKLLIFYVITFVLTVILAVGQQTLAIDFEKIVIPQLAPSLAFLISILIFPILKTKLNYHFDQSIFRKSIIAFFIPLLLFAIGFACSKSLGLKVELTENLIQVLPLVVGGMFVGAIGEEIAWRGFAQPNLEKNYSSILSSIIIGIFWGLWHIGHYKNGALFMLGFLLFTISASIILRFLLEGSNNNVILPILFHLAINIGFYVFYKTSLTDTNMILLNGSIWLIPAIILVLLNRRKNSSIN